MKRILLIVLAAILSASTVVAEENVSSSQAEKQMDELVVIKEKEFDNDLKTAISQLEILKKVLTEESSKRKLEQTIESLNKIMDNVDSIKTQAGAGFPMHDMGMMGMPGMGMPGFFGMQPGRQEQTIQGQVRFYDFSPQMDPFIPLLESSLPQPRRLNINPEAGVLGIITTEEGHDRAMQFIEELKHRLEGNRSGREENLQDLDGKESLYLEVLLLRNESSESEEKQFSPDAQAMGLYPEDLSFFGNGHWVTHGKGIVRTETNNSFILTLNDCEVQGRLDKADDNQAKIAISFRLPGGLPISTAAGIRYEQPTILISGNYEKSNQPVVAVVRVKKE